MFHNYRRLVLALALLLVTVSTVVGCGQKGPLYLPDNASAEEQEEKTE